MPAPWNDPQVDNRPPAYGCGPSYGMLGPSRIVIVPLSSPPGWEEYLGGVLVPYLTEGGGSPFWFGQWKADFDDIAFNVFLSTIDPHAGLWRLTIDINAIPPSDSGSMSREYHNFVWGMPPYHVDSGITGFWGACELYRIREWSTVTARFPDVRIPD